MPRGAYFQKNGVTELLLLLQLQKTNDTEVCCRVDRP